MPRPGAARASLLAREHAPILPQRRPAQPDAIILDIEDSVALEEKDGARILARNALGAVSFYGAEKDGARQRASSRT
ncbi:MAG: aldolase/citrate lyase family protein [Bryobacteraceae bacterium]